VDHAPDVVIRFDRALRIRYVNPVVETFTGRPPAELLARTVGELGFDAALVRGWEAGLRRVVDRREPEVIEFPFDTPTGRRHFESRLVPEFDGDGAVRSVIGITRDVTARWLEEDRFRRSEAFLAEAQRIAQTGSWSRNRVTGAVTWSDEHYRIFQADPAVPRPWSAEALRALFWERVHPADRALVERTFARVTRDFTPLALEFRIVLPDGAIRHVRAEGGRGDGDDYIGTTMDVTAARRAEEELRRSEAFLAEGQRLTHTGSWALKAATGDILWSREMYRIYGFAPEDGAPRYEAVLARAHPDDAPGVDRAIQEAFRTGSELRLRTRILVPGRPMQWVETYGHPVRGDDGTLVEYVGTVVDVTERVRADRRQRRALRTRYEAVLAERARIARDMHDGLLQDLTGIALQLGALLPHARATPEVAARVQEILQMTEAAGRGARLALQGMREHEERADLVGAVQQAAQRIATPAALALTVRVSGRPRAVPGPVREAAVSILHEAMTNVRKHAHARAVRVAMAFASRRFRLSVRDDGRGLPVPEEASGGAEHFGLLGMHERATGVGATLTVTSAPGRGTLVRLDVPFGASRARGPS
jgi:PAS domain S-box-containing protein